MSDRLNDPTLDSGSAQVSTPDQLGDVAPGHFSLGAEIARGGMGRVVQAQDRKLGRTVAVKQLLPSHRRAPGLAARFEREALITARLQHPAIVPIYEAGKLPGGEPFYAMRLVAGSSLDRLVARAGSLAARMAFLPRVVAVAQAIAYAHSQRVIHRDLKPQNILAGEHGETVVVDWGLAKDLADPSYISVPAAQTAVSSGSETQAGALLGTPAYMPPEQARGEAVDERADVWSLGAILYYVLAGQAPYTGDGVAQIVERVKSEPPRPLGERQPDVPADLLAIVGKAMARDAADRYPTAKELADDLVRFETGQLVRAHQYSRGERLGRWLRRHRAAVAVALVGLALAATVAGLAVTRVLGARDRAEREERTALAQRRAAEELVAFMLADLYDRLVQVGKLDLLEGVGHEVERYYATIAPLAVELEPRALARRAHALAVIGDVRREKGNLDAAAAAYGEALAMRSQLAGEDPDDERQLLEISNSLGEIAEAHGRLDEAGRRFDEAAGKAEALVARAPDDAHARRVLSRSLANSADVALARGQLDAAQAAFERAAALALALAEAAPDDGRLAFDLATQHDRIGQVRRARGNLDGALAAYQASLTVAERMVARSPGDSRAETAAAIAEEHIGFVRLAQGNQAGARVFFEKSLARRERLVARDPTNAEWQDDLAVGRAALAAVPVRVFVMGAAALTEGKKQQATGNRQQATGN